MPKLTFYPLGNADTCLIDLQNGAKLLFDYAATRNPIDKSDKRIDLSAKLKDDLSAAKKTSFDVVAFTHLDDDHTHGAEEFFQLDHADKYQGTGRIGIRTLWVPAGVITESRNELEPGAKAIQAEARYRLKKGYGIRVFSRPVTLRDWLESGGLTPEDRRGLITDAGQPAPEFTLRDDGVEFFVHSPFGWRQDQSTVIDRNGNSLVMHVTFEIDNTHTKAILGSDVDHTALSDIVAITSSHKNKHRLEWDVFKLPHHCSYLTLSDERGDEKTEPVDNVRWLFENQGRRGAIIVSSSKPIPVKGTEEDNSDQPPHRQAAKYYDDLAQEKDGEFNMTMMHPKAEDPQPIEIDISGMGARLLKRQLTGAFAITSTSAPRAGF